MSKEQFKVDHEHRKLLKDFISNPCIETLEAFSATMAGEECLLCAVLDRYTWPSRCPEMCRHLAYKRRESFDGLLFHGCKPRTIEAAWKEFPAMLLRGFIEFDAYLDTLQEEGEGYER